MTGPEQLPADVVPDHDDEVALDPAEVEIPDDLDDDEETGS